MWSNEKKIFFSPTEDKGPEGGTVFDVTIETTISNVEYSGKLQSSKESFSLALLLNIDLIPMELLIS